MWEVCQKFIALRFGAMKLGLNVIGPQVRRIRIRKGWTQPILARKLQLLGWDISVGSLGKVEAQIRRVPDCELMFLAKALGIEINDLFPKTFSYRQIGPAFQSNRKIAIFPTRGERD